MKTSVAISCCALIVCGTAAMAAAQGSRPPSAPPPAPPPTASASTSARPAPTVTPAPAGATAATDYRLVNGDKLRIEVYKDPQLSQSLQIRPDGKITLPLVGDVPAAGKTSAELRDTLATSLKEYMNNPVVTVIVVETVPPVYYVVGEVNQPGPQTLTGQVTVLQALAAAGGFKDFAKTKDIRIQRKSSTGVTTLRFNYKEAINGEVKPMYLQPGDTIIVP